MIAWATMANIRKKDTITCIQLSKKTRDRLAEMGNKKDTYEDIVKALMNFKSPIGERKRINEKVARENKS